jgi:Cft2 family RNA processing exonuclease
MFMVDIAGVRILYTGDYSREEDRHLRAADLPAVLPRYLHYRVNLRHTPTWILAPT